ncbi:hypothetical protein EON65_53395 [archaeon]|nr:MAG: hypothetical protein EON65_53395 [archaeon]
MDCHICINLESLVEGFVERLVQCGSGELSNEECVSELQDSDVSTQNTLHARLSRYAIATRANYHVGTDTAMFTVDDAQLEFSPTVGDAFLTDLHTAAMQAVKKSFVNQYQRHTL